MIRSAIRNRKTILIFNILTVDEIHTQKWTRLYIVGKLVSFKIRSVSDRIASFPIITGNYIITQITSKRLDAKIFMIANTNSASSSTIMIIN